MELEQDHKALFESKDLNLVSSIFQKINKNKVRSISHMAITKLNKMDEENSTNNNSHNLKKKKRGNHILRQRKENFCDQCNKSYFSYAALYTHKRNKHTVIPVTSRPQIFKLSFHKQKYHYTKKNGKEDKNNINIILNSIKKEYIQLYQSLLSNPSSLLFIEDEILRNKKLAEDSFIDLIQNYLLQDNFKSEIPSTNDIKISNVNNMLLIYSTLILKIVTDNFFLKLMIKFILFFREYLNIAGWRYLNLLMKNNIIDVNDFSKEFCIVNNCIEIPNLINDYISIFIEINGLQAIKKEIIDICDNFCNWLLINKQTNIKLLPN